jgi:hypothetical protein
MLDSHCVYCGALSAAVNDLNIQVCCVTMQSYRGRHVADVASAKGFVEIAGAILTEVSEKCNGSSTCHVNSSRLCQSHDP